MPATIRSGAALVVALLLLSCRVTPDANRPPDDPSTPAGVMSGSADSLYHFATTAADPDGDSVAVRFDWGDGYISAWTPFAPTGDTLGLSHAWHRGGTFLVRGQAMDCRGDSSGWSQALPVAVEAMLWPYRLRDSIELFGDASVLAVLTGIERAYAVVDESYCCEVSLPDRAVVRAMELGGELVDLCARPDNKFVYVADAEPSRVWAIRTADDSVTAIDLRLPSGRLAASPDGLYLYVAHATCLESLSVIATSTNSISHSIYIGHLHASAVVPSPDGGRVYFAGGFGDVVVIRTTDWQLVDQLTVEPYCPIADAVISPDGRYLYCAMLDWPVVTVLDIASRTVAGRIPLWEEAGRLSLSPSGDLLLAFNRDSDWGAAVIRTSDLALLGHLAVDDEYPVGGAFGPADGRLYLATDAGRILVFGD